MYDYFSKRFIFILLSPNKNKQKPKEIIILTSNLTFFFSPSEIFKIFCMCKCFMIHNIEAVIYTRVVVIIIIYGILVCPAVTYSHSSRNNFIANNQKQCLPTSLGAEQKKYKTHTQDPKPTVILEKDPNKFLFDKKTIINFKNHFNTSQYT